MSQRITANSIDFSLFDMHHQVEECEEMSFCADYLIIHPGHSLATLGLSQKQYNLNNKQLVLLAPLTPFKVTYDNNSNESSKCDILHFRLNSLGQTFIDSIQFQPIMEMLEASTKGLLFDKVPGKIFNLINQIENTFDFIQVLNLLRLLKKLSYLKPAAYLSEPRFKICNKDRNEQRLHLVTDYIDDNIAEPLMIAEVAQKINMGESTFSRFFHSNTGKTFRQYVIEKRIRKAARHLVSTDWSISTVSAEVGFQSLSNFNAKFKALLHTTPSEYRSKRFTLREGLDNQLCIEGQINQLLCQQTV